jgi:hypothetical protein
MIDQAFREQDHVARRATNVHESNEEEDSAARRGEARRGAQNWPRRLRYFKGTRRSSLGIGDVCRARSVHATRPSRSRCHRGRSG